MLIKETDFSKVAGYFDVIEWAIASNSYPKVDGEYITSDKDGHVSVLRYKFANVKDLIFDSIGFAYDEIYDDSMNGKPITNGRIVELISTGSVWYTVDDLSEEYGILYIHKPPYAYVTKPISYGYPSTEEGRKFAELFSGPKIEGHYPITQSRYYSREKAKDIKVWKPFEER